MAGPDDARYEQFLAAVRERITRFMQTSDPDDIADPAGERDLDAMLVAGGGLALLPPKSRDDRERWLDSRHAAGLLLHARGLSRGGADGDHDLVRGNGFLETVLAMVPAVSGQLAALREAAARPARRMPGMVVAETLVRSPLHEVDQALQLIRHDLRERVEVGEDTTTYRTNLAAAVVVRYRHTGDRADLDAALELTRGVLTDTAPGDQRHPNRLNQLGNYQQIRFAATADLADLGAAEDSFRQALAIAAATDEDRPMFLANLGRLLLLRGQLRGDVGDLETGLGMLREAVTATPPGDLSEATRLAALGEAHLARFAVSDQLADVDAALEATARGIRLSHPQDLYLPERMLQLAAAHLARYEATGSRDDAREATAGAKRVQRVVPRDHPLRDVADVLIAEARKRR